MIIDNDTNLQNQLNDTGFDECGYQFCGGSGYLFCIDWTNRRWGNYKNFNKLWNKPNDIIEIDVDLNKYKIEIAINDNDKEIVFENIRTETYRLVLSLNQSTGSCFRFL